MKLTNQIGEIALATFMAFNSCQYPNQFESQKTATEATQMTRANILSLIKTFKNQRSTFFLGTEDPEWVELKEALNDAKEQGMDVSEFLPSIQEALKKHMNILINTFSQQINFTGSEDPDWVKLQEALSIATEQGVDVSEFQPRIQEAIIKRVVIIINRFELARGYIESLYQDALAAIEFARAQGVEVNDLEIRLETVLNQKFGKSSSDSTDTSN